MNCYKIAVGVLGIDPEYFLNDMTEDAYVLAFQGWDEQKQDQWEQTRQVAYSASRPYLKGQPTAQQFLPLKWDKKQKAGRRSTRERFDQLKSRFDNVINQK